MLSRVKARHAPIIEDCNGCSRAGAQPGHPADHRPLRTSHARPADWSRPRATVAFRTHRAMIGHPGNCSDTTNTYKDHERTPWQKIHAIGKRQRFHRLVSLTKLPMLHHRALTGLSAEAAAKIRIKIRSGHRDCGDRIFFNWP